MSGAEPILTANEERAAAALRLALRHESEAWPLKLDAGAWLSGAPRRRRIGRRLRMGIAAVLAVVLAGAIAYTTLPLVSPGSGVGTTASAGPSIPGTAGHFDNGDFSFDYPSAWQTLSGQYDETIVNEVDAVLGTGSWRSGCLETMYPDGHGNASCTGDSFDVSGGRVVVKVWRQRRRAGRSVRGRGERECDPRPQRRARDPIGFGRHVGDPGAGRSIRLGLQRLR
jgi:hypothetical protein